MPVDALRQRVQNIAIQQQENQLVARQKAIQAQKTDEQLRADAVKEMRKADILGASYRAKVQKELASKRAEIVDTTNSVKLSTGEFVDKKAFESLPKEEQSRLSQLGVTKYNEYAQSQVSKFQSDNVQLKSGEYVSRADFESLDKVSQQKLSELGIDKYNKAENAALTVAQSKASEWQMSNIPARVAPLYNIKGEIVDKYFVIPGRGNDGVAIETLTGFDTVKDPSQIFALNQKLPVGWSIRPSSGFNTNGSVVVTNPKGDVFVKNINIATSELVKSGTIEKPPEPISIPAPKSFTDILKSKGEPWSYVSRISTQETGHKFLGDDWLQFNVNGKSVTLNADYADKYLTMLDRIPKSSVYKDTTAPQGRDGYVILTKNDGTQETKRIGEAYNLVMTDGAWKPTQGYDPSNMFNIYIGPASVQGGSWGNSPRTLAAQVAGANYIQYNMVTETGQRPATQDEIAYSIQSALQQFSPAQLKEYRSELATIRQTIRENPNLNPISVIEQRRAKEYITTKQAKPEVAASTIQLPVQITETVDTLIDKLNQGLVGFNKLSKDIQDKIQKEGVQLQSGDWTLKDDYAQAYGLVKTKIGELISVDNFNKLSATDKELLISQGLDKYNESIEQRRIEFENDNIKLGTGEYISKSDFDSLPESVKPIVKDKGVSVLNMEGLQPEQKFERMKGLGLVEKNAEFGGVDPNTGDILLKDGRSWQEQFVNIETAKDIGIGLIPIAGTAYFWNKSPWWANGISAVADVMTFIPVTTAISQGVRAGKGFWVSVGRTLLAEAKAPITTVLHPIESTKALLYPVKTLISPSKIPVTSAEIRYNTVKIPVQALGDATTAKETRDILTKLQIMGDKPKIDVNGTEIELAKVAINQKISPAAVHATENVDAFLNGAVISESREGGLFVAPTLSTRFTTSSAYGDITKGGTPGALIIRDNTVLSKLQPSGKIYRGQVEIEKVVPGGVELPKPSQILKMSNTPPQFTKDQKEIRDIATNAQKAIQSSDARLLADTKAKLSGLRQAIVKERDKLETIVDRSKEQNIDKAIATNNINKIDELVKSIDSNKLDDINEVIDNLNEFERRSKITELTITVIGKPFSKLEIARLKFIGAADVIGDMFRPSVKISGKGIKEIDELADLGREARTLDNDLQQAIRSKNTVEIKRLEGELQSLNTRARSVARQAEDAYVRSLSGRTGLRAIGISTGDYIDRISYRELAKNRPVEFALTVRSLPRENRDDILRQLDRVSRNRIELEMSRLPQVVIPRQQREQPLRTYTRPETIVRGQTGETIRGIDRVLIRPTDRITSRIPSRVTPRIEGRPPTRPPERPPTRPPERPPIRPPIKTPPIIPTLKGVDGFNQLSKAQKLASVAWKQGFAYDLIYPPYGQDNVLHSTKPFPGVKVSSGPESAYRSLARVKGEELPNKIFWTRGAVNITFERNKRGKPVIMSYKARKRGTPRVRRPEGMPEATTIR